jgi:hypothetical protein
VFHTPTRTARNKELNFAVLSSMMEILIGGVALLMAISLAAAIAPKRSPKGHPWPFASDLEAITHAYQTMRAKH